VERLFVASHLAEAYLVYGLLTHLGLRASVMNEYSQGALGELPPTDIHPEVWIEDPRDMERARQVVQEYERRQTDITGCRCRACGEESPAGFELCWNCSSLL